MSCLGCTERHVGCHSKCEKYAEYCKKQEEIKARQRAESIADYPVLRRIFIKKDAWYKKLKRGIK